MERKELEEKYGKVWDTDELTNKFEVKSFIAPFCFVRNKETGSNGFVEFQHYPRFYFNFIPDIRS